MRRVRVMIERGHLITPWMSPSADVGFNVEPATAFVEQPLTQIPEDEPATGSYRGEGTFSKDTLGREVLIIGDPMRQAYLTEYLVGDATPESQRAAESYFAGFRDGLLGRRWPATSDDSYAGGRAEAKTRSKDERAAAKMHVKIAKMSFDGLGDLDDESASNLGGLGGFLAGLGRWNAR